MFCVIGIFLMFMVDCFVFSDEAARVWFDAAIAIYVVGHVIFALRKRLVRARELKRIAGMGHIDTKLREHLISQGICLNEDGTLTDPGKYHALMDDVVADMWVERMQHHELSEQNKTAMQARRKKEPRALSATVAPSAVVDEDPREL